MKSALSLEKTWESRKRSFNLRIHQAVLVTLMLGQAVVWIRLAWARDSDSLQLRETVWLLMLPLVTVVVVHWFTLIKVKREMRVVKDLESTLAERNARQSELTRTVFHYLGTPMATISGYAHLLSDPELRHNEAFLDKLNQCVIKEIARMDRITENAIKLACLEGDGAVLDIRRFHLAHTLEKSIDQCRKQFGRDVIFDNQAGDIIIEGDMFWLHEAWMHLIHNGINYSEPPSPVVVRLVKEKNSSWVDVQVTDYGIGISAEDLDRLFQRFGRIVNEKNSGRTGGGLGLYLTQQIVTRHNGRILVTSQPGVGSTFTICLPVPRSVPSMEPI